jgi:hypothetical protein
MRPLARIAYRAILCLHPHDFRAEFGDEMLWVFDEEMRDRALRDGRSRVCGTVRLLLDGLRSVLVQHAPRPRKQQPEAVGPYYCEIDSSIPAFRFTQAGILILSFFFCIFSLSLFASMVVPKLTVIDSAIQKNMFLSRVMILSRSPALGPQRTRH